MSFKLAFDKNLGLELFVSKHMYYDNSKKIFFSSYNTEHMIGAIGSFLLIFLNTDFEDDEDCKSFVFWFCFENIDISKYNIPYYFESEDILAIIALMFKEFMSDNHNTIRQCQNCGYYFVPSNLKETKYCNVEYENTGKTCRQIGKELAYKKSLKEDKLLHKYRKRYMSLASSVSHYGTNTAIARFEKYKKDGAIIKQKYLNKEISPKEFEKWILDSKK